MILSQRGRCLGSLSNRAEPALGLSKGRTLLSDKRENLQCLLGLRLSRTGGGARPHIVRGLMKLLSPTSPNRTPTPPTTSSKSLPTARRSYYVTSSSSLSPAVLALPSPASSPCARFSTDELTSPRPKPSAT